MSARTIVCTPCLRNDNSVDAAKYCVECNENFCRPCLRRHIKQFLTRKQSHRFLDRDEMPGWLQGVREISYCTRHPGNLLHTWCRDHDVICCGACAVVDHSACANVEDFQEQEEQSEKKSEVSTLITEFIGALEDFNTLLTKKRQARSDLRKTTAESLASVRAFRQIINTEFDRLEKYAVEEIDTECISEDNAIERDIGEIEKSVSLVQMSLEKLRKIESENISSDEIKEQESAESENTENSKDSKEGKSSKETCVLDVMNGKRLLQQMKAKYDIIKIKSVALVQFESNKVLENYVKSLSNLGHCRKSAERMLAKPAKTDQYPICEEDETICDIQHIIQSTSGNFLMTDAENKCIKVLDSSYHLSAVHHFEDAAGNASDDATSTENRTFEPFAICQIDDSAVGVSMVRDKLVQVYHLAEKLEKVEEIEVGAYCRGLAYNKETEELYVACGGGSFTGEGLGEIRVYRKGELQRTLKQTPDGKTLAPRPGHIALSMNGSKLFIADADKGVLIVSSAGEMIGTFTAPELEGARGICTDVNDYVIVSGSDSNDILRIHDNWRTYDVLHEDPEALKSPQAVCYDAYKSKCVCSLSNSNSVSVVKV